MTGAVPDITPDERRGLWLDVLRWPLSGGMLLFVIAFAALAALSAALEGGPSQAVRETRSFLQAGVIFAAVALLGIASRRAIACTWPAERLVPWLRDEADETPLTQVIGSYLAVLFISFLPMALWVSLRGPLGAASWVSWLVIAVTSVYAGATLPLGLAAAAVKGTPAAAFPGTLARMRRAEPYAARIAAVTGIVFVGAIVLSFWMAALAPHPTIDMSKIDLRPQSEPVGPVLRWSIAAVRAAAFYAAIVSCRVSGLLVREVPGVPRGAGVTKKPHYAEYLRIDELLALQGGLEKDESKLSNHEVLFVVVHQVFELWFKLMIRELRAARDVLKMNPVPDQQISLAVASLRRVREILDQAASHFRVVETLTTRDFLDFRDKITPASGFESAQMRELEVIFGLEEKDRIHLGFEGSFLKALRGEGGAPTAGSRRVEAQVADRPTLKEAVDEWLFRTPIRGSSPGQPGDDDAVKSFLDDFVAAHRAEIGDIAERAARQAGSPLQRTALEERYAKELESTSRFLHAGDVTGDAERARRRRIRAALVFIESYREQPLLAWPRDLCDTLLVVEQAFVIFRQRHARMVEREIGRRTGTGGSAGVDYLDKTALEYRVFRDFWAVRTILVPRRAVPPLEGGERYDFRHGS